MRLAGCQFVVLCFNFKLAPLFSHLIIQCAKSERWLQHCSLNCSGLYIYIYNFGLKLKEFAKVLVSGHIYLYLLFTFYFYFIMSFFFQIQTYCIFASWAPAQRCPPPVVLIRIAAQSQGVIRGKACLWSALVCRGPGVCELDFPNPLSPGLAPGGVMSPRWSLSLLWCDRLGACSAPQSCPQMCLMCSNCCPFS